MPKIVIVDDDAAARQAVTTRLTRAGFDVLSAEDPDAASKLVMRERPDAILVDISPPPAAGMNFRQCLQLSDVEDDIPIICMSGHGGISNRQEAFRHGAKGYVSSPYDPHELISTVTSVLSAKPASAAPSA
ncbi:MAG TPA: response regulator [Phycisphaerae bacterium]|nr:response regulator [Phycisphaerae bacterium]